jgi:nucleoside-diphosphate-sugar epimerase
MKTVFMTGASGYLGGRITQTLLKQGYKIIALTPNAQDSVRQKPGLKVYRLDKTAPEEVFRKNKINGIIHLATCYGRAKEDTAAIAKVNIIFPLTLLELAVKYGVSFFINTDTILAPNLNAYALTKSQFAAWLDLYSDKIKAVNMRLDHFYGPFDNPSKFIAFIIKNFKQNIPELDLTEGSQLRDFIYVDDVINAYALVLKNIPKIPGGKINNFEVATGVKISIKEAVLTIKELLQNTKTRLNFGAIPFRKNEVLSYDIDASVLRALGWRPKLNFRQGIKKIIQEEGLK